MARAPYVSFTVRSASPGRRVGSAELVQSVLTDVRAGRLPAGSRLPPVRVLEHHLGLSKNTAQAAYDELVARGVLVTREREGVFVGEDATPAAVSRALSAPLPDLRAAVLPPAARARDRIALSTIFIDPELLPRERLADCARSVLRQPGLDAFYDAQGHPPLRELIATRLRARGLSDVTAASVVITTGSQQAIDVLARAMVSRKVALESPVYWGARLVFESQGMQVTGLPLDPFDGVPLAAWREELARVRPGLFYAITSYQNPTGYSYTSHELTEILGMARELGISLAEDDWGSDMLSGSEYRPTLRALGGSGVVYINSFTKKVLPSLRVGFLVADPSMIPSLVEAKRIATLGNAWLTEAVLAEFLDRGYYDTHLTSLQRELDCRYLGCLETLREVMPEGVRWTTPGGGPTLWLEVPRTVDLAALSTSLGARGVSIEESSVAFLGTPHLHGFRVSYAFEPPDRLQRGLTILAEELRMRI